MQSFLNQLKLRNPTLYYFGWINIIGALISLVLIGVDDTKVMNINAWIKPLKFFISIAVFSWTMTWLLSYLKEQGKVRRFSIMVIAVLIFEQVYVCIQAARGQKSHFNFSSSTTIILYSLMGVAITVLVVWTAYFAVLFFRKNFPELPSSYVWGIRLGLTFFVIFSMAAHFMASSSGHTVGSPDGGPGLPLTNWSTRFGDLRVAHFVGMHALQILPFFGYYISRSVRTTVVVCAVYFLLTAAVFIQALIGKPLINL